MPSSSSESDTEEQTIANDLVVTKYNMAGEIANKAMKLVIDKCIEGATVQEICQCGDSFIEQETAKTFKKNKDIKKGIAFPTCISINNCICHFSPLTSDSLIAIKAGDLIKIDLGVHVDGFIAVVGHTLVVGPKGAKISGRIADVILAAYYSSEICQRLIKDGNNNEQVTKAIQKISESFKCKPVEGMVMNQLQQHEIEGKKSIIQNPSDNQKQEHEKADFKMHEVYAIDCLISTGDGKFNIAKNLAIKSLLQFIQGKEKDSRTTVFKKTDEIYNLKLKASRAFFSEIEKKYGNMPFSLRSCEDEKKARLGVVECVNHKLMTPYPVLWEKDGEFVAQIKFTLLLMPNGSVRLTSNFIDPNDFDSAYKIDDEELNALLKSSIKKTTKKKKTKKNADSIESPSQDIPIECEDPMKNDNH